VPDPGSGGAGTPALAETGDGSWADARARATATPRLRIRVSSNAAVDASSTASRSTWERLRRCPVSAGGRDSPGAATPPTTCRLGPDPPAACSVFNDQWSRVALCHRARATSSWETPSARCHSLRCRLSHSNDSASIGRLDPRPGAPRTGVRGEPLCHASGAPSAWTSVLRQKDGEPRWSAYGRGPRAGSSTHPPPCRRLQPGPPLDPRRGPRRPRPMYPRGLPPLACPSPGYSRASQTEERPASSGENGEDPRAMEAGPAYRLDVLGHRTAIQSAKGPRLWYQKKCRSATRIACVRSVSAGAPNVVPQFRALPQQDGSKGRPRRSAKRSGTTPPWWRWWLDRRYSAHSGIFDGAHRAGGVTEAGAHAADRAGGGAASLQDPPLGCSIRPCLPVRQVHSCCARRTKRSSIRRSHSICLADPLKTAHSHSCAASEHAAGDFSSPLLPQRMVSWCSHAVVCIFGTGTPWPSSQSFRHWGVMRT